MVKVRYQGRDSVFERLPLICSRFNICRESLDETRQICELLIDTVLQPHITQQDPKWLMMSDALLSGMWVMQPMLNTTVFLNFCYELLNANIEESKRIPKIKMTFLQQIKYIFITCYIYSLRLSVLRVFSQYVQYIAFWLMRNFPFLVFYKFGYSKVYVPVVLSESSNGKFAEKDYMLG